MSRESPVHWGFGVTCGVILAIIFSLTLVGLLFCGGCGLFVGGRGAILNEASEAARREQERQAAERLARQAQEKRAAEQRARAEVPDQRAAERAPAARNEDGQAAPDVGATPAAPNEDAPADPNTAAPANDAPANPDSGATRPESPAQTKGPLSSDVEEKAAAKLKLAESLLSQGKRSGAKRFLQEIVRDYPGTAAAGKAASKLEGLK